MRSVRGRMSADQNTAVRLPDLLLIICTVRCFFPNLTTERSKRGLCHTRAFVGTESFSQWLGLPGVAQPPTKTLVRYPPASKLSWPCPLSADPADQASCSRPRTRENPTGRGPSNDASLRIQYIFKVHVTSEYFSIQRSAASCSL